mgnify:CR=1 FL=1
MAEDLYGRLQAWGIDVLLDDRDERAGVKFATMELIGLPWQVTIGPRGVAQDTVELKSRATGETITLSPPALVDVMGGAVSFMFDGPATSIPLIKGGKIKVFATTAPARVKVSGAPKTDSMSCPSGLRRESRVSR